jgi:calcium-dependent protein kinase
LLTGFPPFNGEEDEDIMRAVSIGKYNTTSEKYTKLSPQAKDLISQLLKFNPSERITAKDALNHPWFKTEEFQTIYRVKTINVKSAQLMITNLEYYKSDNIIKCAVLAYLVHQNTNMKECVEAGYLFNEIDSNQDGKIEKSDLANAFMKYSNLNQNQASKKANSVFLNIDTDKNGFIESEEFIRACINPDIFTSEKYLRSAFSYFDNDGDGTISIPEVESKFFGFSKNKNEKTKLKLRQMFDQIDENKDGVISYQEFSNMIKGLISS